MANYIPWVELYRPKTLDEVIGQDDIVKNLKAYVKQKNFPHLIFAGPAGTGKTTCALALAHDLYGEDYKHNILDMNASDERGIDVVRGKIKDFARSSPIADIPFKIIFLDESDALTPEAQQALRRTMELYSGNCRFILSANWSSKIIEPIQSRCAVFRFKPLSKEAITIMVNRIAKGENLKIEDGVIDALIELSEGDMRKAINVLQSVSLFTKHITVDDLYSIVSSAKPSEIDELVTNALNGNFEKARSILDNLILNSGMAGEDILLQIYKNIIKRSIADAQKAKIIDKIGEYNFRMVEGANERIQLEALIAYLSLIGKGKE